MDPIGKMLANDNCMVFIVGAVVIWFVYSNWQNSLTN